MQDIRCFETDTKKAYKLEYKFTNSAGDQDTFTVSLKKKHILFYKYDMV